MHVDHLEWLPSAPEGVRRTLRSLLSTDGPIPAAELIFLAQHALGLDDLTHVAKAIGRAGERLEIGALSRARLAILCEGTVDHIAPAIQASALRHGVLLECYVPPYGRALPEVIDSSSALSAFGAQIALVGSDYRSLGLARPRPDPEEAAQAVAMAVERLAQLVRRLTLQGITTILQNVPVPPDPWTGHHDLVAPGSPAALVRSVNDALVSIAKECSAILLDTDSLASLVGRANWFDPDYWFRAKFPFAPDLTPFYADHVARLLGAIRGKARKCLVLDLDNTCWGGIIGDDGLEGIKLGQGSADGEAFLEVQSYALALRARGVVLAVVSKNEDDAARLPFRKHPEMLLREDHIAVFLANWEDKATNIQHVARVLNIGLDALAFLDDNPAERARVRQMLPDVAVLEVPESATRYAAILARSGLFETLGLSDDDMKRAEQYRDNASRSLIKEQIGDYDTYLQSLEMICDLRPFDAINRTRITQLVNKSNQFNLTTRRYTESEIAAFESSQDTFHLQVRLGDRFGDNGMISVVIFRKLAEEWLCDTWLMSCRVLERRVEEMVLNIVAQAAMAQGAKRLIGEYHPTPKNKMVANHFAKLGFEAAGPIEGGGTRWTLELAHHKKANLPLTPSGPLATLLIAAGEDV